MPHTNPTFKMFTGCMFSAKTSRMLLELERFKYQHKKIMVFKPKFDDRYSEDEVVTHGGWKIMAKTVDVGADILGILATVEGHPDVIAIDEAFMISGIADVCIFLYKSGFHVAISSLDMSSAGKPFKEIEKMFPWATHIEKCSAVCVVCGKDAFYTYKKQDDDEEITIGGAELYEPRCWYCHPTVRAVNNG